LKLMYLTNLRGHESLFRHKIEQFVGPSAGKHPNFSVWVNTNVSCVVGPETHFSLWVPFDMKFRVVFVVGICQI